MLKMFRRKAQPPAPVAEAPAKSEIPAPTAPGARS